MKYKFLVFRGTSQEGIEKELNELSFEGWTIVKGGYQIVSGEMSIRHFIIMEREWADGEERPK